MTCSRRPCEPLGCSYPLTLSGHCCPTCQGKPALPLPLSTPRPPFSSESPGLVAVTPPPREPRSKPTAWVFRGFLTPYSRPPLCPCCHLTLTVRGTT